MDKSKLEKHNSNLDINETYIHPSNYILEKKVNIYEDEMHEFKQFNFMDKKDLHEKITFLSKYLCAFLNSNSGVVYLGVNDDGIVKGIRLSKEFYLLMDYELRSMIEAFDKHVSDMGLVLYQFNQVFGNFGPIDDTYVLEIFIKQGKPDHIYTTPYKDPRTNDYQCFIKMNGIVKKIDGVNLNIYIKNKIKNYLINRKD
jgi:predicted HTH transcriptional regulator